MGKYCDDDKLCSYLIYNFYNIKYGSVNYRNDSLAIYKKIDWITYDIHIHNMERFRDERKKNKWTQRLYGTLNKY